MSDVTASEALQAAAPAPGDFPLPLRSLLDAGVHFGHQTKRWNPKMRQYIYGARNGIHIIDLSQTVPLLHQALLAVTEDEESWALHRWPAPGGAAAAETVVRVPRVDSEPVTLSPDGRWVAVARAMGAELFDAATGKPAFAPTHRALITAVSVWNDGTVVTVSDDSAWRFRELGRAGARFDVGTQGAAINADGDLLARTVKDGGETLVEIVDLADAEGRAYAYVDARRELGRERRPRVAQRGCEAGSVTVERSERALEREPVGVAPGERGARGHP